MESLITYFIKINLILTLLFLACLFLLRNEKFFKLNRFIFFSIIIFSFALPLLPYDGFPGVETKLVKSVHYRLSKVELLQNLRSTEPYDSERGSGDTLNFDKLRSASERFSDLKVVVSIYIIIVLGFFIRFIFQLFQLSRLLKGNETRIIDGIVFHTSEKPLPPFSFFWHLVVYKLQVGTEQFEQIVSHEKVHIKHWHIVDILVAELMQILFWINPIIWMFNRYMKLNIEYIADEEVLKSGVDRRSYQVNILTSCLNPTEYQLATLFNNSQIKLRIKMMNATKTPVSHIYKYALILPIAFAAYILINPVNAQPLSSVLSELTANNTVNPEGIYVVINAQTEKDILDKIDEWLYKFDIDFEIKDAKFNADNQLTYIQIAVDVPGVYQRMLTSGNGMNPLSTSIIFYSEKGSGSALIEGSVPEALSARAKLILTNNLNGLMIVYDNQSVETHGTGYTNWK